ncbi:glutamine amidotransferase domain protein, partial [Vibrio parahaemolyticus AQ3810]
PGNQAPTEPLE